MPGCSSVELSELPLLKAHLAGDYVYGKSVFSASKVGLSDPKS